METQDIFHETGQKTERRCLFVGCLKNIEGMRRDAKYCCSQHRTAQWLVNLDHGLALRTQRAKSDFDSFVKHSSIITCIEFQAKSGNGEYRFNTIWELLRDVYDFHIKNAWKIPCKEYLKKYHPEICKLIKDLN